MNKNRIIGILLLVIICGAGFYLFKNDEKADQEIENSTLEFTSPKTESAIVLEGIQ